MRFRSVVLAIALGLALSALAGPGDYTKRDNWRDTLIGAREALVRAEAEAAGKAPVAPPKAPVTAGPWYHIGPFATQGTRTFADAAPPEKEIELDKAYEGKYRWTKQASWTDGVVRDLPGADNANTYLFRTLTVEKALTVTAYFGSDDGLVVWCNGKKLISQDVPRGAGANQASAKLELAPGENKLLLKIHNNTGGHGYYFSLAETPTDADPKVNARNDLWSRVERDFPDAASRRQMAWERQDGIWNNDWPAGDVKQLAGRYASGVKAQHLTADAKRLAADARTPADLAAVARLYERSRLIVDGVAGMKGFNAEPLRRALNDMVTTYGARFPQGKQFLARLETLEKAREGALTGAEKGDAAAMEGGARAAADLEALKREALLANPVLAGVENLVFVKRKNNNLGLPTNWQGNTSIARNGYDNELATLNLRDGGVTTLYKPEGGRFVGNLYLHWNADRLLFSMPDAATRWQIQEIGVDGKGLRQIGPADEPDVDNYDACYLPSGNIMFCSTRVFHGVPCVGGADAVGNLCVMGPDGKNVRMLCFDQDHNWCPTVTNDGRVLYTRWEYSDTAHYFTRILFKMNPDGTHQQEVYGSNSYWPNAMFYTRAIPDSSKVVTIVTGHHGVPRMGELLVLDPNQGRREASGVVQRIPGWGQKVEPLIVDGLVNNSWPKFLHPYPLNDKYYLVSCKPNAQTEWGLYLVDVFDNMLLLKDTPGYALFEPVAVKKQPVPPVIPDKVDLTKRDGTVYIADIYQGPGLKGIPRGTVKNLKLYSPHYSYNNMGGHINIGIEGPWDVRRILGTVPVHPDGSAAFKAPANTPISFMPLDAEGKSLQMMRSWYTAMPGEVISCAGCHESQNDAIKGKATTANQLEPPAIKPWRGPVRGFSWKRDIQRQVLDKFCVGCHDGKAQTNGKVAFDLTAKDKNGWGGFTPSYIALHPFVRRHGPEGDDRLLTPMDFYANTSQLVQMLQKGHYNVKLDEEAWDRLYTWIDLNVPDHGTWTEHRAIPRNNVADYRQRRLEMRTKYANNPEDPEAIPPFDNTPVAFVPPAPEPARVAANVSAAGWPFDGEAARKLQLGAAGELSKLRPAAEAGATPSSRVVDLGNGVKMEFVLVPAGEYVMGSTSGARDEQPVTKVKIASPFWMSVTEVSNEQYRCYDPKHDSRFIDQQHKDHTTPGYPANLPKQPVIRVPWTAANQFCNWLSVKTGASVQLPTEAQWEWACRAGTATPFWYGDLDTDFGKVANLADQSIKLLAVNGVNPQPVANPHPIFQDFTPKDARFNDRNKIQGDVGTYEPNAWGLRDMHGNVCEWTRSTYRPYPYVDNDGRNDLTPDGLKVARGGSWYDRPFRATASWRLAYFSYQPVWDVGFRVILEDKGGKPAIALAR